MLFGDKIIHNKIYNDFTFLIKQIIIKTILKMSTTTTTTTTKIYQRDYLCVAKVTKKVHAW
jgi:hypothetical protein